MPQKHWWKWSLLSLLHFSEWEHKGPGDEVCENGGVWGCPGVTECYEEDEKHFARHVVKTQQSCSSQESRGWDRLCIPPPWPSDEDIKPSVKTEMEPGHSESFMLVFTGQNCLCASVVLKPNSDGPSLYLPQTALDMASVSPLWSLCGKSLTPVPVPAGFSFSVIIKGSTEVNLEFLPWVFVLAWFYF